MTLQLHGESVALSAIEARLQAQGVAVVRLPLDAAMPTCLWLDGMQLDLSNPAPALALARLQAQAGHYLDLAGPWSEHGTHWGFAVCVGMHADLYARAKPVLDALAPARDAWLDCGPPGSATFTHQCLQGLQFALHLALPPSAQLDPFARLSAQQQLQQQLQRLADRYLACHPLTAPTTPAFPPLRTPHFAQALAGWLHFTLAQCDAWQRLVQAATATP